VPYHCCERALSAINVLTMLRNSYYTPYQVQLLYQRTCLHAATALALTQHPKCPDLLTQVS
jgi:hypothetical protein